MRLLFTFLVSIVTVLSSQAQERVRNVRVRVTDSSRIEILYDMINARPGDSVYLNIRSRLQGELRLLPNYVRGDVGYRVAPGPNRRIVWDALANGYTLDEEIQARILVKTGVPVVTTSRPIPQEPVVVQQPAVTTPVTSAPPRQETVPPRPVPVQPEPTPVTRSKKPVPVATTPNRSDKPTDRKKRSIFAADSVVEQPEQIVVSSPVSPQPPDQAKPDRQQVEAGPGLGVADTTRVRRSRYNGPAWALLSAVAPGIGNIFVQTPKPRIGLRPAITVGCYGLLIYGFMERQKSQDAYHVYEQQKNMTAGEPYYQTANTHHQRYFIATRGALIVAAADVVLTFIKGVRNRQIYREAQRFKGLSLRPGLQAGQPTAVVHYSF